MTVVEWLVEEINKLTGLQIRMDEPIIEKAKEMEKQQLEKVYQEALREISKKDQYGKIGRYIPRKFHRGTNRTRVL